MADDAVSQFGAAIIAAGLPPPGLIIPDSTLHRFGTNGRANDDAGWYVLHVDGIPAGAFGCWRSGVSKTWRADVGRKLTPDEERAHRESLRRMRKVREAEEAQTHAEAAARAAGIWDAAAPAPNDHPYLRAKGICAHSIRVQQGALVIPMRDASGHLYSLQFITAEGAKRFVRRGKTRGCYHAIGGQTDGTLCVGEGFATAATVHEATGYTVAVAFSAANLLPVAECLRAKFPGVRVILAGDNDHSGTGQRAAEKAARAVNGFVAVPATAGADWNDVMLTQGVDAVRSGIEGARGPAEPDAAPDSDSDSDEFSRVKKRLAELAELSPIEYDRVRKQEAKNLSIQLKTLDAEVGKLRVEPPNHAMLAFDDPEPWSAEVDGGALLSEIRSELEKYLVLPTYASTAIALWAVHTWCLDACFITPYLHIRSAVKRSGKSRVMILLQELVRRPLITTSASTATIFRGIEEFQPTLLLDEADAWLRENDELRGILNGGHSRKTARVLRIVGENHEVRAFSTFCPKAFGGIGRLADTLEDRSISIAMKRKRAQERVDRLREDRFDLLEIRRRCARWANDNFDALCAADPEVAPALHDRAADNWRPLFAIADAAGGGWPAEVRKAAAVLTGQTDDDTVGTQLLADIHAFFNGQADPNRPILSSVLVEHLGAMEERPWSEWRQGKPITKSQLARQVRAFEIRPRTVRIGSETGKGYRREQFEDAFGRYLPPEMQVVTTSHPHQFGSERVKCSRNNGVEVNRHTVTGDTECDGVTDTSKDDVTGESGKKPSKSRDCDGVTDQYASSDVEVF